MGIVALVLVALGGTVAAYVMEERWPATVALGAALLALGLLVLPRGSRPTGSEGPESRGDTADSVDFAGEPDVVVAAGTDPEPAPTMEPDVGPEPDAEPEAAAAGASPDAPGDDLVVVVPGRRRYHRPGCDLVEGLATEEIHVEEARAEGFTRCTTCQ